MNYQQEIAGRLLVGAPSYTEEPYKPETDTFIGIGAAHR